MDLQIVPVRPDQGMTAATSAAMRSAIRERSNDS
jgi:hypothetical protein